EETLAAQEEQQEAQLVLITAELEDLRNSLQEQSDRLLNIRGDMGLDLTNIQDQLSQLSVLTGQVQRTMVGLSERIVIAENQNSVGLGIDQLAEDLESDNNITVVPPEEIYEAAMVQFNRGSFGTARRAFENFLADHPDHRLAPSAQFFLADLLDQENSLEEATNAFLRILELYPTSERVPQALYRAGSLFVIQENFEEAVNHLERLVNTYPDSGPAELARELLQEIP
ncbi:uncharacterized protein METZ01_LOCUS447583, partial [marine metagenome]